MQKKWMDGIAAAEKRHRGAAVAEWCGGLPAKLRGTATRRIMASVLAACMMFTLLPINAFAVQGDIPTSASSLACHTTHDTVCGYTETIVTGGCTHTHDTSCGYIEGSEGAPCNYTPKEGEESSAHEHDTACGYKEAVSPAACTHQHVGCGYAETVTVTSPCTHTCELCKVQDSSKPDESAAQCVCTALCTADAKNAECAVCGVENADLSLCSGENSDKPDESAAQCVCTALCTEDAKNAECAVCSVENADLSLCKGEAAAVTPAAPSKAAQAVIDLIDALPGIDEIHEGAVGDSDPGYADWLAKTQEILRRAQEAQTALDALSVDDKAAVGEERTAKLAALVNLSSMLPQAQLLSNTPTPTVVKNSAIYANGASLLLVQGSEFASYTVIYIDNNNNGEKDADDTLLTKVGDFNDERGNDLSPYVIYGGSKDAVFTGDTKITMLGGKVQNIYGGGYAQSDGIDATVTGNTNITISGGTVTGNVYGGGFAPGENSNANVTGNTSVTISGGTVTENVYGSGYADASVSGNTSNAYVGGSSVTVSGGTVSGNVYGGGRAATYSGSSNVNVTGSTSVTISSGKVKYIYGGGYAKATGGSSNAKVNDASVSITGGTVSGITGGGYADRGTATVGSVNIEISGGKVTTVYGDGTVSGYVGTATVGSGNIKITGGTASNVYGGADGSRASVTVGGSAKAGIVIYSVGDAYKRGVEKFAIASPLSDEASITVKLPIKYDGSKPRLIATGAAKGDLAKIKLEGGDVSGDLEKMAYLDYQDATKIMVRDIPERQRYPESIFANGAPLLLVAGKGDSNKTVIYVDHNMNGQPDETDTIFDPDGATATMNGTEEGNDLSAYTIYAARDFTSIVGSFTGDTNITMLGGKVKSLQGTGVITSGECSVTGNASISISDGTVTGDVYGSGGAPINGNTSITITGGTVSGSVYGGGQSYASVTGSASITITGGTVSGSVYGCGKANNSTNVKGTKTLTIGGAAKIGSDTEGIIINGGYSLPAKNGVNSFIIDDDLTGDASCISVKLPFQYSGYPGDESHIIATDAAQADLDKIKLIDKGAEDQAPYLDGTNIRTRTIPTPTVKSNKIYANGAPLLLVAGKDDSNKTVIYIDKNYNGVKDGSDTIFTGLSNDDTTGNDLSGYTIYGGKDDESFDGDTKITITGGKVDTVYGGCYAYQYKAKVIGDTNITITGGTVTKNVYGGSSGGDDYVTGKTNITIGGDVKIGDDNKNGVIIKGNGSTLNGVNSFVIDPDLSANASVSVVLSSGYDMEANPVIATSATKEDFAKIKLIGYSASNKEAYLNGEEIQVRKIPTPTVEGQTIYANGASLILVEGSNGKTVIYTDKNNNGIKDDGDTIFYGGYMNSSEDGNDLSKYDIYGGGVDTDFTGDTKITITGGKVNNVYGGGVAKTQDANVTGNISVEITGGTVNGNVYGGGVAENGHTANVGGNTSVSITGGTVNGNVTGGGTANGDGSTANVGGNTSVSINSGTVNVVTGGGTASGNNSTANVSGGTSVTVGGGTVDVVNGGGTASGSGSNANVTKTTTVTVNGGTVGGITGGGTAKNNGTATVTTSNVTVNGGTVSQNVYGGGNADNSGTATVTTPTVTIGGGAKIGDDTSYGVVINGGTPTTVANGVDSFAINPDLSEAASISVVLPAGYDVAANPVIATGAVQSDLDKIILAGEDAASQMAHLDGTDIKVKAAPTPEVKNNTIYANGAPLILVDGTEGNTVIYIDKNNNGIKDKGDTIFTGLSNDDTTGNDLSNYDIYGGGVDADVTGDTKITITGGKVNNVYGGGVAKNENANVTGNISVEITGGTVNNVYGGGVAESGKADVTGNISVEITGGTVNGNVYGGGVAESDNTANVSGNTSVSITGGTVNGNVTGGGNANVSGSYANVGGNTSVSIKNSTVGGVTGGGNADNGGTATVGGTSNIEISNGATVSQNVYGGGNANGSGSNANVTKTTTVTVNGGTVSQNVYGGNATNGGTATAGSTSVTIGGGAKIGDENNKNGVIINGGNPTVENGVNSFAINPDLSEAASISVVLPAGYDVANNPVIATVAAQGDLAKITLTGDGAADRMAYLDGTNIKVKEIPTPTVEGQTIHANGAPLILADGADGKTVIYIDKNNNGIKDDGDTIFSGGNVSSSADGNDLSNYTIYGGDKDKSVIGDTKITITGGKVNNVYGGGVAETKAANVTGSTSVSITGGKVNNVYGGGVAESGKANVGGSTSVSITGGKVNNVYGGGVAESGKANVGGSTSVSITGGTVNVVNGGGSANGSGSTANVSGTSVTVSGGTVNNAYGGGNADNGGTATVGGTSNIEISNGATVSQNVYGGGNANGSGSNANVTKTTTVTVNGGTVSQNVYSGGNANDSGTATVNGGTVTIGGGAKIGNENNKNGVIINGGNPTVANGVNSFAINPDLSDAASISVVLPAGYEVKDNPVIATDAKDTDLAKIKLTGDGAADRMAYLDGTDIKVKVIPTPTVENDTIYANGAPLILADGANGNTVIYIDKNNNGKKDDGDTIFTGLSNDDTEGNDLSNYTIYGGDKDKSVIGDAKIVITGGKVDTVYGGGVAETKDANVTGNISVEITGGTVNNVYGGGVAENGHTANVDGNTSVSITGGTVTDSVNGGGTANGDGSSANVSGDTSVTVSGGKVSNVNGGGSASGSGSSANVSGDTSVTVSGGTVSNVNGGGNASGSGSSANVSGGTSVTVSGGTVDVVNGGGNASGSGTSANVSGGTSVTVSGGTVDVVNGGGNADNGGTATVDSTNIEISNGAKVSQNVYGGGSASGSGSNANVTKTTTVTVNGGTVSNVNGGGDAVSGGDANVGGNTSVSIKNGTVDVVNGGGNANDGGNANVSGGTSVTVSGGKVTDSVNGGGNADNGGTATVDSTNIEISNGATVSQNVYGGGSASGSGSNANVTKTTSVTVNGGTVSQNVYGGGDAKNNGTATVTTPTVTIGGGAKIGDDTSYGVVVNGGKPTKVTNGVDSFVIDPDLSADASVSVKLPAGYEATVSKTIATDAKEADLTQIKLTGDGANGKEVNFENTAIKVKAIPLTGTVTISGELQCNKTLTATVDNTNNTGTLSYQWKRGSIIYGTNIGTNSNTYSPGAADVGSTIVCVVTSSAQGGSISGTTTGTISKMESPAAPSATFTFDGENANKLVGTTTAMQYSLDGGNTWTDCTVPNTDLTSVMNSINEHYGIQLRVKETETQQVGAVQTFTFSKGGTVSGVSVQGCTTSSNNDGQLLGVTTAMEYQKVGESKWTSGTGNTITGLTSGNYLVRIKATGTVLAGNSTSFTVAEYSATPSYGISLSETGTYTFAGANIGYSEQTPLTVQIGNSGNQPTGQLIVQLTGTNKDSFTLSSQSIGSIAVNGGASFTVKPKTSLAGGTYTATVTVNGGNRISRSFNVSFTVIDTTPTVTSVAVSPSATSVQKGTTQQFTVAIQGANNPAQTVTWEIVGSHAASTSINPSGLLTVAADETQATLTVKATSTVNTSKSSTATVTVTDQPIAKYTLTVMNGTGGGEYAANASVPITANAPENNKVFDKWTTSNGGSFVSETSATTQFTMPAGAVTVTATYKVDTVSIDTAITAANTAKSGITVNNNPASSVASGTKFVTSAEMDALDTAIATAQAEKSAATTIQEVQAAADKLNAAVAAFNKAIKTGTYTNNSGGNSGSSGGGNNSGGNNSGGSGGNSSGNNGSGNNGSGGNSSGGNSSGGNSSGGSGSNGSGGTPSTAGTLPENMPNVPATAEINVTAKTDDKGNTVVDLPNKMVDNAIDKALDAAKKNGTERNGVSVQVNVNTGKSSTGNAADSITVSLPKATQERLIEGRVDRFTLVIDQPDIAISLDLDAIRAINTQAKTDVKLTATQITDTSGLSAEARAAAGGRPVFSLEVSYQGGDITSFAGGDITLEIPYQLEPGEQAGGLYLVYIDEQGKTHFITDSSYDAQRGVLMGITSPYALYCVGYKTPTVTFSDTQNHWAKENIEFVTSRDLLAGTGTDKFSPDAAITRGMFVAALGRLAGIDPTQYKNTKLTDVAEDAYYAPYAVWAVEKGIVSLTDATIFAPNTKISREQMAVIMASYAKATGYTVPKTREAMTFADSNSIASKAKSAVKAMQMAGVVNCKDGNRFDPKATATRAEVSAVLHRYVELVINPVTAQGLDVNDSGSVMLWESGKVVKSQRRTVDGSTYAFNGYGEAALPVSDKKQVTSDKQEK